MAAPRNAVTVQCAGMEHFMPPPLDHSIPFAEFVDWHMTQSPKHEFARLVSADGGKHAIITMRDFGTAVHILGRHFLDRVSPADPSRPVVVPVVLATHSLLYVTIVAALLRVGFQPFPIAPSMPEASVRNLLQKTNCQFLVASVNDGDTSPTTSNIVKDGTVDLVTSLSLEALYPSLGRDETVPDALDFVPLAPIAVLCPWSKSYSWDDFPTFVIHTSGSTDLPKAIPLRQKALASWFLCGWFANFGMGGWVLPTGFLPSFHVTGVATLFAVPLSCGIHIAMDDPSGPTTPSTPTGILEFFKRAQADFVLVPPILCEIWSQDNAAINYLKTLKVVVVGTAALNQNAGDKLISGGVNLLSSYGSTEGGQIWQFRHIERNADWAYGKFAPYISHRLIPAGLNRFRVELLETEEYSPAQLNTPDGRGFNTHDIVEKHPNHADLFKVVERDDNQLVLVTGESVLVAQLENVMRQCSAVKQVAAFGHGRPQLGMIVEPRDAVHCDGAGISRFREIIRPYLLKANALVPPYAQVPSDLIVVTGPQVQIPVSAKGSVPRALVAKLFARQIDDAYSAAVRSRSTIPPPENWSSDDIRSFVRRVVHHIICGLVSDASLDDNTDLFRQGCTSIHAAYIRSALVNGVEASGRPRAAIPMNVVYLHPTILQLADFISAREDTIPSCLSLAEKLERMGSLADRLTSQLPRRQRPVPRGPGSGFPAQQTVLLTGTTGALGTYILGDLLSDAAVGRVFVLIRQAGGLDRQIKAFIDRGTMPTEDALKKLTVLQGDVCKPQFDLTEHDWQKLVHSVTSIVHCAWRLDFNLNLNSFVPYLSGVSNLIALASASLQPEPPHIVFTSSVDTVHRWISHRPAPEQLLGAEYAVGSGYGESKWVADHILSYAADELGLRVTSIRISQLCGSRINGCWNTSDWVPQVVRAGTAFGALPADQAGAVAWLPLDIAAKAVVCALQSSSPGFRMLNLEHPNKAQWRHVFAYLTESVVRITQSTINTVARSEWISMLRTVDERQDDNPHEHDVTLHIAQFVRDGWADKWEQWGGDSNGARDATGVAHLEMRAMLELFPELSSCAAIGKADTDSWVEYWALHGLFSDAVL